MPPDFVYCTLNLIFCVFFNQVRLETSRDGQELDPGTGQTLLNNLGVTPGHYTQPGYNGHGHSSYRRLDRGFYR